MFGELGKVIGTVVGTVGGMTAATIASILELPVEAVKKAMSSGCKTYDEIRKWTKWNGW